MNFLLLLPPIVSFLVLAAHFFREGSPVLCLACFAILLLLLLARRRWVARLAQVLLVLGFFEWLFTTFALVHFRRLQGHDWQRAALILLAVAALHLLAAALLNTRRLQLLYSRTDPQPIPAIP